MKIWNAYDWYGYRHFPLHALLYAKKGDVVLSFKEDLEEIEEVDVSFCYLNEGVYENSSEVDSWEVKSRFKHILVEKADFRQDGIYGEGYKFGLKYVNLEQKVLEYTTILEENWYKQIPTIITKYGCGLGCSFCYMRNFRVERDMRIVKKEFRLFEDRGYFEFYDSYINERRIYDFLKEVDNKKFFGGLVTATITLEEIEYLAKYNCKFLHIGIETKKRHEEINKRWQKQEKYEDILSKLEKMKECDIIPIVFVMYGLREQSLDEVKEFLKDLSGCCKVMTRLYVFEMYPKMDVRGIVFEKLRDSLWVVKKTEWMSEKEIEKLNKIAKKENMKTAEKIVEVWKKYD